MENKLIPGILIGAIVGGAATLADKSTQRFSSICKDVKEGNRSRKPSKFNSIKDEVLYWKDTIEEIRRNNPELEKSIKDAKDTFVERKNNRIGQ